MIVPDLVVYFPEVCFLQLGQLDPLLILPTINYL